MGTIMKRTLFIITAAMILAPSSAYAQTKKMPLSQFVPKLYNNTTPETLLLKLSDKGKNLLILRGGGLSTIELPAGDKINQYETGQNQIVAITRGTVGQGTAAHQLLFVKSLVDTPFLTDMVISTNNNLFFIRIVNIAPRLQKQSAPYPTAP